MEKKVIIELTVEVESPDDRSVEEDIIGALSESLHHFDVVITKRIRRCDPAGENATES